MNTWKRWLSLTLCLALCLGMLPVTARAANMTIYRQNSEKYRNVAYGTHSGASSVYDAACGPFSLANLITYMTGKTLDPLDLCNYAVAQGARVANNGTYVSLFTGFTGNKRAQYGISYVKSESASFGNIVNNLKAGYGVIANIQSSGGGHYVTFVDYNASNNTVLMLDSYWLSSRDTTNTGYTYVNSSLKTSSNSKQLAFNHSSIYIFALDGVHVHAEIKKGSSGTCVSELQTLLNQRIGAGLTVDGVFGTATENALKTFQSQSGLAADGICGPNTWAALEAPPPSGCSCSESYAGNYIVTTTTNPLNIRSEHDASTNNIIGTIPKGATVYVSKGDGTWAHVEYNGTSGYASMTYLTREVPQYTLNVNGWIDGAPRGDIVGCGAFSIRINDGWAHGNADWNQAYAPGTTYELYNIVPNPGYTFNGIHFGSRTGTINDNTEVVLDFSRIDTSGIGGPVNTMTSNGVTYSYYNTAVTWYTAKQFCEEHGGHLVTISSEAEHNIVRNLLGNTTAWLGATEISGSWQWVTGEPFSYAQWAPDQADDAKGDEGGEDYLEYWANGWNDTSSYHKIGFVMESASVSERILPDGNYIIANAGTEDKSTFNFLDIGGGDYPAKDVENVNIWGPCSDELDEYDVWTLTYVDGFYTITQYGTDMALTVQNGSSQAGDNVCVRPNNWWDSQRWTITPNYRDGYRLTAKCSGLSLDLDGGNVAPGTNVKQWEPNDGTAQSWLFMPYRPEQPIANGRYMLISTIAGGLELDVVGNSGDIPDNTNVQLWDTSTHNQYNSFDVIALGNGYYKLIHAASGKALDAENGVSTHCGNIVIHEDNGSNAQQWAITRNGDGYLLRARCSGLALDVEGGQTANGTNIRQHYWNGAPAQTWCFVPAEHTVSYDANGGTGAPAAQTKYFNNDLTLSVEIPTRLGYDFAGWAENPSATTAQYPASGSFYKDDNTTLYAVWQGLPIVRPDTGLYRIATALDITKGLDIETYSLEDGGNVQLCEYWGTENQLFRIVPYDDFYFNIQGKQSGKLLDVRYGDAYTGNNVWQWTPNNETHQNWYFEDAGDGYVYIRSALGFYLDVADARSENETNIQICNFNGCDAQRFKLIPYGFLDLNWWVDGEQIWNEQSFGTADVIVNGELLIDDCKDYYGYYPIGTPYRFDDIKPTAGHRFDGVVNSVAEGTVNAEVTEVWLSFSTIHADGVALNKSDLSLTVGASETLTATVNPSNAANQAVTWTTSNSSVASVSNGKVTAVGAGTAAITVTTADGGKTATCEVTVTPEPETNQTVIRVGTGTASPNQTVTIPVSIENNSGIAGAALTVRYDSSVLTLDAIEKGEVLAKGTFSSDKSSGLIQWFYTDTNEDITADGTLFTLTFTVNATAEEGSYAVSIVCKDGESANLSNMNSDTVSARFAAGAVSVTVGVKGDVTGDNKVLMNDVVKLARSVAGYVTLTERENTLGDVTGDGKVLMNDVVKVARYVAGFITTLEPSVSLLGVSESAVIEAGTVSCEAGETISVPVMITQNPGIAGAMLEIQYDANALTLTGIERGEVLGKGSFTGDLNTGIIQWYYIDENSNTTATGCLFTLHFTVKDGASGNYPVTVQIRDQEPANLSDIDAEPVNVQFSAGGVQVGNAPSVALSAAAEGESSVRVTLTNAPVCAGVYCAVYAANGQMLGIRNLSTTGGTQTLTIPCNGGSATIVKVLFTDGTFRPTEKAVECPVK